MYLIWWLHVRVAPLHFFCEIVMNRYSSALVVPASLNEGARMVNVVFATETPVRRYSWQGEYDEVLLCDASNVRLDRVSTGLPVLNAHNTYDIFNQLGRVVKTWFERGQVCASIQFSQREEVDKVFKDIKDGIITSVSVGYRVFKYEKQESENGAPATYRAIDWMPMEVSLVSVPADVNAGVRSMEDMANENGCIIVNSNRMEDKKTAVPAVDSRSTADVEAALKADRERLAAMLQRARSAGIDDAQVVEWHRSGMSDDAFKDALVDALVARQAQIDGSHSAAVSVGTEAIDKKRNAIQDALLHRINSGTFKLDKPNEYRGMTLVELAREMMMERGQNTRGMDKLQIADMLFKRTHSTSDFPLLMEGVIDRMLRANHPAAPEYWHLIARQTSVSDYRPKALYMVDSANGMKETAQGAELAYTTMKEGKETLQVRSYAEGIKFTRQAFINDDLGALSVVQSRFVRDWNELRGTLVWGILTDNKTMSDGKALFEADDHKNLLTGAATALSFTSMDAALKAFKTQRSATGRPLRIVPKYLAVSPELEATARRLLADSATVSIAAGTTKLEGNIYKGTLELIVEPRLTGVAWYLIADPNAYDGLYYGYLDGGESLRVNNEDDFDTDSMKYAVRGEFGAAAVDFRPLLKVKGTA